MQILCLGCIRVHQTRTWVFKTFLKVTLSTGDIPSAPASLHWKRGAVVFTFVSNMSSMESVILTQVVCFAFISMNANAAV
tara:strand:+ start:46 stop:285 length:240 start_codon:yes stop_codon:yes gene_type:complete